MCGGFLGLFGARTATIHQRTREEYECKYCVFHKKGRSNVYKDMEKMVYLWHIIRKNPFSYAYIKANS